MPSPSFVSRDRVCPCCGAKIRHALRERLVGLGVSTSGYALLSLSTFHSHPLWTFGGPVLVIVGTVITLLSMNRVRIIAGGPFCAGCHYDLSGAAGPCPECGREQSSKPQSSTKAPHPS